MSDKNKVHPLHSPGLIMKHIEATGSYIGERGTGRTTAAALALLAAAMKSPYTWMLIRDHAGASAGHPANGADRHMMTVLFKLIATLAFEHFDIDKDALRIRFGKDPSNPTYVR